jgi:hypothetical protein
MSLKSARRIVVKRPRSVPHSLTAEQEDLVAACQDLIKMADSGPDFLKSKLAKNLGALLTTQ